MMGDPVKYAEWVSSYPMWPRVLILLVGWYVLFRVIRLGVKNGHR